jgi:hypothetical protein
MLIHRTREETAGWLSVIMQRTTCRGPGSEPPHPIWDQTWGAGHPDFGNDFCKGTKNFMVSLRSAQFPFYAELQISKIFESQSVFLENSVYMFVFHVRGETKGFL